jgi:serine/threonine protein kinase
VTAPEIPGYTYVSHLGTGGFAEVFLYEQEWPRQRVAVKVVRRDVPLTDHEKRLFASEANAMARLADHPYIVSVTTAGITTDGRPYLVMRYCPPPDLGVRVRSQPMAVADAVSTGIKLASAIETAHRSGILHRDIKPSNVLVTTYQEPALADFGIASHVHEPGTDTEVRISYPWSPPEMVDGSSTGSVASDVYSLGATIWNLLVGRSPFAVPNGDNSARALSARILHAAPPSTQRPDVPPALDRLLQQCLAKQASHRPRSALELARGLQVIEAQAGLARTPIAVEGDVAARPVTPSTGGDPDVTHVKPMSVVATPRPQPRAPVPAPDARTHGPQQPRRVVPGSGRCSAWPGWSRPGSCCSSPRAATAAAGIPRTHRPPRRTRRSTWSPRSPRRLRRPRGRRSWSAGAAGTSCGSAGRPRTRASPRTPGSGCASTPGRATGSTGPSSPSGPLTGSACR